MKKKIIMIVVIVIILLGLVFGIIKTFSKNEKKEPSKKTVENITLEKDRIQDQMLISDKRITLKITSVNCENELCHIDINISNNSNEKIDLTEYRISFIDENENEIEWYNGEVLGKLSPKESINSMLEIKQEFWNNTKNFTISNHY